MKFVFVAWKMNLVFPYAWKFVIATDYYCSEGLKPSIRQMLDNDNNNDVDNSWHYVPTDSGILVEKYCNFIHIIMIIELVEY